jgi:hypothetical protein
MGRFFSEGMLVEKNGGNSVVLTSALAEEARSFKNRWTAVERGVRKSS